MNIEQAMLDVLAKTSEREEAARRQLRALFVELGPAQANDLIRRIDTSDDPLAEALRRFIRRRR